MKKGYLSEYFEGVAAKRLSAVEADVLRSNQHEFNGVEGLRQMLGEPDGKVSYQTKVIYLQDSDSDPIIEDAVFTWYDARQRARLERGVMRWEYRLYFPTTNVSLKAVEGDLMVIAKRRDSGLMVIVAEGASSIARQIEWLFGFSDLAQLGLSVKAELGTERDRIEFASRVILESMGVEVEVAEDSFLDEMLKRFGGKFPTTKDFSAYARSTLKDVSAKDDADKVLMAWMEREEILFRTLERHLIADRLSWMWMAFLPFPFLCKTDAKAASASHWRTTLNWFFRRTESGTRVPVLQRTRPSLIFCFPATRNITMRYSTRLT